MRLRRCTIDSSCIIALDHLDLIPQLSLLFSLVLVPKAVREDVFKRRTAKHRLQSILSDYDFFQRCDEYERSAVGFLLTERNRESTQDRGEVEAVVQAAQTGAVVIVDDPWGRQLAARYDLEFHGTLWVLERFHAIGLMHAGDLRDCFISLRARGLRLPWPLVDDLLVRTGVEPLGPY